MVFCLLDRVVYYERKEFEDNMAFLLVTLLCLSARGDTDTAVKAPLTSQSGTVSVRQLFLEDLTLLMEPMAALYDVPSPARFQRQLEEIQEAQVEGTDE